MRGISRPTPTNWMANALKPVSSVSVETGGRCDAERLPWHPITPFGAAWLNPPYDHSKVEKGNKRIEFVYLRHSWKWLQDGGLALWCIYGQHITEEK